MVNNNNFIFESDEEEDDIPTLEEFEDPVQLDTSLDRYVMIDNVPKVGTDKLEKLKTVIFNRISVCGEIVPNGVTLPMNGTQTAGVAFVEFTKKQSAVECKNQFNGFKFDSNHFFKVNLLDDYKKYKNFNETFQEMTIEPFREKISAHDWLKDKRSLKCYDQFVARYGDFTDICWNEMHLGKPAVEKSTTGMTSTYVHWSNSGNYLVTFHLDGIALYGGSDWESMGLFEHKGVQLVDFSPDDNYMITFAPFPNENPKDPKSICVWDIRSGKKLKMFPSPPKEHFHWPAFTWSAKDQFFAKIQPGKGISIYEASTLALTPLVAPEVKEFSWSPSDPYIVYFVPATEKLPGKVTIAQVSPQGIKTLTEKNIWDAIDVRMHWQNDGDYICVKVNKDEKKKKKNVTPSTSFELFRTHEPNFPCENFEVNFPIRAFAWEPRGKKFCIIHGEHKVNMHVSFYEVGKNKVKLLTRLENRKLNAIFWSPRGTHVVLANLNDTGELEFFNTQDLETFSTQTHLSCTGVDWNPSGRYVTTFVSHWKVTTDTGYNIWTFNGDMVYTLLKDRFYQFSWRPRPKYLLTTKEMNIIKSNYKKYQEKFDAVDLKETTKKVEEEEERLQALMDEFLGYLQRGEQEYQSQAAKRQQMGCFEDIDKNDEYEAIETVEEIIDIQTTILPSKK
ncbi:RNA-binding region RNP-1 domain-containing protein [Tieghemostelium lacteum]|uniref:Eukaryotic translation initiation factor 3 subunit B n=1 Tax=Tieghemostelium lacteum TaxID=361077 RepID=A0A152A4T9_TIELA|nr:RNA-binding region RNP-1 domain-containing protein [Tieghemostelium lacteum]|eukprot:KYR01249.1 RNA-binding region RNP-1 domain-containing protein [Tieghemostelium lacteum]